MKNPSKMLLLLMFASTVEASKIPLALEPTNARSLGSGYDSRTQTLKPVCVDNATDDGRKPVKEMEIPIGALSLRMQKDERAVADKLEISAKGKYKTGVTTAQASADFLNESKSNEFSLSYNYIADYTYVDTLEQSRAFPIRPLVGYDKIVKDSKAFFARCGDEYVRAISYAARLFVNINVSFVSKSQKNKFAADFSMNSPTLDLEAHAKQISTSFSARNVMTIQAIQYGGDPSKLGKVLCPGTVSVKTEKSKGEDENKVAEADLAEKTEADPNCVKASRVIVKCSFGDLSKCARVLELAISYANSQDGTNFPAQIAGGTAYAKISLETAPYRDLPPPFTIPPPPEEALAMKAARTRVSEIFDKQHELLVLAQKLYSGQAPRLSDEQKSKMEVLKNFHFKNVERAVEAVTDCYGIDRKLCSEAGDKLRDAIDPDKGLKKDGDVQQEQYDAIMALTDAETFVQYCDIGDDKFPEVRQTMLTLRAFVEENLKESNSVRGLTEGDFCANLASKLEELQVLDLSQISENPKLKNLLLGDLRPIGTLKNLKVLKLPKQNLMSVKPLAALKNLVELNLDGNYISDVSDLSSLEKLERLSVQNNRIDNKTMAVLGKLKLPQGRLVLIDARGNQFELTCPLPEKSNCKLLSFSSYTQIPSVATHCPSVIYHQAIALNSSQVLTVGGQVPSGQAAQMQVIDLNSGQCITKSPSKIPRIG
ncbi:MAG: leucine-rich repeat domain-containing protein, partial [Pseudobdellovibrionaceae bacterium]